MKLDFKNISIYLFAIAPVAAILCINIIDTGYYNLMSALFWFAFMFIVFDSVTKKRNLNFPIYLRYLLLFAIYTIISDFILAEKSLTVKYLYSNYILSGFIAAFVIENMKFTYPFISKITLLNIIMISFAFIVIIYQELIDDTFLVNQNATDTLSAMIKVQAYERRLPSIYSWTSLIDQNFGFIVIITCIISERILRHKKTFITLLFIIIAISFAFLTRNRWIMVNSFLIILMFFVQKGINIKNIIMYGLASVAIIAIGIQTLDFVHVPVKEIINNRILEKNEGGLGEGSAGTRIFAFTVFAKLFPDNPVFGKGELHAFEGTSKDYKLVNEIGFSSSQIHVGYLSLLYYYGILGALPFVFFLFSLLRKLRIESRQSGFWGGYFSFFGFLLANLTLVNFPIFYAGLILSLVIHKYYIDRYMVLRNEYNKKGEQLLTL